MTTDSDPDLEAFLHIVHISDMHCKGGASLTDIATERKLRAILRALRRLGRSTLADLLEQRWENGLAGHDPLAHDRMCEFLRHFASHPQFAGIATWLLDTGDLSTLGDNGSLQTALGWLNDYAAILSATEMLVLQGNHDAWPGRFPLFASDQEIHTRQLTLRQLLNKAWPDTSIQIDIPHCSAKLRLNAINSTTGNRIPNTLARGIVDLDPPWAAYVGRQQLAQLATRTQQTFHPDGKTRDFRILALHHPVHYPPPRPSMQMSLRNDREVADALAGFSAQKRGLLAHLVLSGHTHATYPALGALPPTSMGQRYVPLYESQLQLIAGSLCQLPRYADRAKFADEDFIPQQCQILTFFASPKSSRQGRLLMERRVVGRSGAGPYKFLAPRGRASGVESIMWTY
jgi:3',5'-cyclic AMP phosphodiesterase CpdA